MASPDKYIESSEEEENLDSEDDYSEDDFAVEVESEAESESRDSSDESDMAAYAGEPLADEEWLKWYEKEEEKTESWSKSFKVELTAQYKWSLAEFPGIIVRFKEFYLRYLCVNKLRSMQTPRRLRIGRPRNNSRRFDRLFDNLRQTGK